jgi:hemerythrin-like domain-containing protein
MRPPLQVIAPRIDDPLELLQACHDKVRRFTNLALRLREHLAQLGPNALPDQQAREAAQSILRYFKVAAPLHHDDEELDLFPALLGLELPEVNATMAELAREHQSLGQLWQTLQAWLQDIADGFAHVTPPELDAFVAGYLAHVRREDEGVYPLARMLAPEVLKCISAAMVARRTAPPPSLDLMPTGSTP